jgi:integrase
MSRSPAERRDVEELVAAYRADLVAAGMFAGHPVTSVARMFFARVGPEGWVRLSVAAQCALPAKERRVVGWLIVTGRVRPSVDYLVACRPYLGDVAAHHPRHREFYERFAATSAELGFDRILTGYQWSAVVKVSALAGLVPAQVTQNVIDEGRKVLVAAIRVHRPHSHGPQTLSAALFGAQTVLFHLGLLDEAPRKTNRDTSAERAAQWASVPAGLAATLAGYIAQVRLSLRPSSMVSVEGTLRRFTCWVAEHAPEVACVADLRRAHIEAYKLHLAARPSPRGGTLSKTTLSEHLGGLRTCFERLAEWGGDDVPAAVLVFDGDLPRRDDPLPRFLDDGAFAKLLQATRADPDPFVRLAVEFLARTGLRKGEFLDLTVDSVVQIGSAYWLHVPLGKLRTDRYIPLHPQLKDLLDAWLAGRPAGLRTPYLFVAHGQRIARHRVDRAVAKVAAAAGIGPVSPHRLRHTLATQAINRGMSLEAIAALLGHKSMRMTMVYARIANRTVADEYFSVSEKVEALYDTPRQLPADAEGTEMRRLRAEMHRRMLGNGYCARPVGLDCHFESICEGCTFFQTTIEFRPTLARQRDDAAAKGQVGRQRIFNDLLDRLDTEMS